MPGGEILRADFVAPMASPLLRDGAIAFEEGVIKSVGEAREVRGQFPQFRFRDLGQCILMPGLINAHTHLELSDCACSKKPPGKFIDWILRLPQRGGMSESEIESSVAAATKSGIEQCLWFGVTCVGDISQYPQYSRPVLQQSPLRAVSFGEVLGLGGRRWRFEKLLADVAGGSSGQGRVIYGVSPHAPYTVDMPGYQQCIELSRQRNMPLATHLSEWPDERDFLQSQTGMFRELFDRLGFWQDGVSTFRGTPIEFAHSIGLLNQPALLAHVNYCSDRELSLLAAGSPSVVYCPRTQRYFGHPPHRWRQMMEAGINIAVGTDSCASSPDLNIVDEIRLLHRIAPEVSAEILWRLITINAARALQRDDIGSLERGGRADCVAFGVYTDDPLNELLQNHALPQRLWIAGEVMR